MARASILAVTVATVVLTAEAAALAANKTPRSSHLQKPLTLFLNTEGATLTMGRGGSHQNQSRVLRHRRIRSVTIPPLSGGAHARQRLVACVGEQFAPFNIQIVMHRPSRAPYMMAVVGGASAALRLSPRTTGIAPSGSRVIADAVAFAFERRDRGVDGVCKTVAHEVGHALGLKHAYRRGDIMSYLPSREKGFLDRTSYCGEYKARRCTGKRSTQNSYKHLARVLGLKQPRRSPVPVQTAPGRVAPRSPDEGVRVATVTPRPRPKARPAPPRRPTRQPSRWTSRTVRQTITVRIGFGHGRWISCTGRSMDEIRACLKNVSKITATDGGRLVASRITLRIGD